MLELQPVKTSELDVQLRKAHSLLEPVLVHGEPGIGKTAAFKRLADELGARLEMVYLNQMGPGDVQGLRFPDTETQRTVQYPPDFLPGPEDPPTIILLDELGTCPEATRKPASELLLERRIRAHKLGDLHWVAGATNTGETGY